MLEIILAHAQGVTIFPTREKNGWQVSVHWKGVAGYACYYGVTYAEALQEAYGYIDKGGDLA